MRNSLFGIVVMIFVGLWMMWLFSLNCVLVSMKLIVVNMRMLIGRF